MVETQKLLEAAGIGHFSQPRCLQGIKFGRRLFGSQKCKKRLFDVCAPTRQLLDYGMTAERNDCLGISAFMDQDQAAAAECLATSGSDRHAEHSRQ